MVIFWFIVITMLIVVLQSWLFKKLVLRNVQYKRYFTQTSCFQDEQINMVEEMENRKRLPIPWLYVESSLESSLQFSGQDNFSVSKGEYDQNHGSFFTLSGYQRIRRTHDLTPRRRGIYSLRTVTLTSGDLFSMNRITKQIPLHSTITVYPKPLTLPLEHLPYHSWQGDHVVKRFIMPDPFVVAGTRPYQYGDSLRHVNWKATARSAQLQVHQYEFTANRKLLVVNIEDNAEMWRTVTNFELIERFINYAAGITERVIAQGMEAGFAANTRSRESAESALLLPAAGQGQWHALLELMAGLQLERTEALSDMLVRLADEGLSQLDILVISSYWNEATEQAAHMLRQRQNAVLALLTDELEGWQEGEGKQDATSYSIPS
jgi:uncharacterized protein (DUF58 family)